MLTVLGIVGISLRKNQLKLLATDNQYNGRYKPGLIALEGYRCGA